MKVVLFCGGLGTRLGGLTDDAPKPMVKIGYRPILWHVMKYYAHFGHKDFILCLGYKADTIKDYFLNYDETASNNFTMTRAGRQIELESSDLDDWKITFVDTVSRPTSASGSSRCSPTSRRRDVPRELLRRAHQSAPADDDPVAARLEQDRVVPRREAFAELQRRVRARRPQRRDIRYVKDTEILINAGFFVFRNEIFHYMKEGEELVEAPFRRLIDENQLVAYRHDGFWCMDTFKEHQQLSDMHREGNAPWEVWKSNR
jgi:glucose-1-phosphate cytidylyltransferase